MIVGTNCRINIYFLFLSSWQLALSHQLQCIIDSNDVVDVTTLLINKLQVNLDEASLLDNADAEQAKQNLINMFVDQSQKHSDDIERILRFSSNFKSDFNLLSGARPIDFELIRPYLSLHRWYLKQDFIKDRVEQLIIDETYRMMKHVNETGNISSKLNIDNGCKFSYSHVDNMKKLSEIQYFMTKSDPDSRILVIKGVIASITSEIIPGTWKLGGYMLRFFSCIASLSWLPNLFFSTSVVYEKGLIPYVRSVILSFVERVLSLYSLAIASFVAVGIGLILFQQATSSLFYSGSCLIAKLFNITTYNASFLLPASMILTILSNLITDNTKKDIRRP